MSSFSQLVFLILNGPDETKKSQFKEIWIFTSLVSPNESVK